MAGTGYFVILTVMPNLAYYPLANRLFLFLTLTNISKKLRINRFIRVPTVRLIDEADNQLGIQPTEEALKMAEERGLDLVEVAPKASPPVCKILDYGKYIYRQNKIEQKHKRLQKQAEMKGIRLSFRIDQHDLETKIRQARTFLEDRNSVKVTLVFRGREAAYVDLARSKLDLFYNSLKDIAQLEDTPRKQGSSMIMILAPNK
jgi:translation initiation factor IF-3